jgi:hypothetical protein
MRRDVGCIRHDHQRRVVLVRHAGEGGERMNPAPLSLFTVPAGTRWKIVVPGARPTLCAPA